MTPVVTPERQAVREMLERARIPPDGVLFVHSAFRGLSARGFAAEAFIEALLDYMSAGTLLMPAMSWRIVTPANPLFDEIETPSHVGIVPELFRRRYAERRSIHPTHSVAGRGRLADALLSGHHIDDTPCSMNSPHGRARAYDAHVLALGVGFERVTAIHHPEEMSAIDVYLEPPEMTELYQCRDRHGRVHAVRLRRHRRLNRDFPQFAAPLRRQGQLREGEIAGTPWIAAAQHDLLATVFEALDRDPRAIIAPPGAPIIP